MNQAATRRIPLALLPGTLCSAQLWASQVAALHDVAEITVIDTAQFDNLPDLARHVHSVMPARFAVAGLSFGGIVAFAVWHHNPRALSHVALMNTTPLPITAEKRTAQEKMVKRARAGAFMQIVAEQADLLGIIAQNCNEQAHRSAIMSMAEEVGIDGFANQIEAQIQRADSRTFLAEIDCPTLILCGKLDTLCPPSLHQEMAREIKQSELVVVPDCGHLSALEQPKRVSDAMREWLLR